MRREEAEIDEDEEDITYARTLEKQLAEGIDMNSY